MTMRTYQTTETTSLLDYQRQSTKRNRVVVFAIYSLSAAVVVSLCVCLFGLLHHNNHEDGGSSSLFDMDILYPLLGSSRNYQSILNSEPTTAPAGCEATVMIIRHCDKNGPLIQDDQADEHCSYAGFQRAHFLTTLFGSRWPVPAKLYALSPGRRGHQNYREVETLAPLSRQTGVAIADHFTTHHTRRSADEVFAQLRKGELCGKLVVICWKHSHMPQLARALGWKFAPSHYPKSTFDQVWQLKYVYQPPVLYDVNYSSANKKKEKKGKKGVDLIRKEEKQAKHMRENKSASQGWIVYGSVENQNFDYLSYSYASGDYPEGGKATGAGWAAAAAAAPDL